MKKSYFYLAAVLFLAVSCNDDDSSVNSNSTTINSAFLAGNWIEIAPDENTHTFAFTENTAVLTWLPDQSSETYNYTVTDSTLTLNRPDNPTAGSILDIERVANDTLKITSLYIEPAYYNYISVTSTFVRQ